MISLKTQLCLMKRNILYLCEIEISVEQTAKA